MFRPGLRSLALFSFACWFIHGVDLVLRGEVHDLLWLCNVAGALLAVGCWFRRPVLVAIPVLWLSYGTPLWILDMLTGSEIMPTAFLSHLGVLGAGLVALRRIGWPRHAWWQGTVGVALVMLAARMLTPPEFNVSLAFRVWQGWEDIFPDYRVYLVILLTTNAATFFILEQFFLRVWPGPCRTPGRPAKPDGTPTHTRTGNQT